MLHQGSFGYARAPSVLPLSSDTLGSALKTGFRWRIRMSEPIEGPRELKKPEALARFSVVSAIQVLGFAITIIPLIIGARAGGVWQYDCLWVGIIAGVLSIGAIILVYIGMGIFGFNAKLTEWIIRAIFVVNTTAFAFAAARTGGPSCSIFGQIIPIQLSGILLLEQQKEKMTSKQSKGRLVFGYAAIAIIAWVIVELFRDRLAALLGWSASVTGTIPGTWYTIAATSLVAAGMAFTAIAYLLPRSPGFIDFFPKD